MKKGILLHISTFYDKYGIGSLGKEAFNFIKYMEENNHTYLEILPLNHTDDTFSPYSSISSMALNPLFISFDFFINNNFLTKEELDLEDWSVYNNRMDLVKLSNLKYKYLKLGYMRTGDKYDEEINLFIDQNNWIITYSIYMMLREEGKSIKEMINIISNKDILSEYKNRDDYKYWIFLQYLVHKQWYEFKDYANQRGIKIFGDIPICLSGHCCDLLEDSLNFLVDDEYLPTITSGAPPDHFSSRGQSWGGLLYDWEYHKRTGYRWWLRRISRAMNLYDIVRFDNFIHFAKYYGVERGKEPIEGKWYEGPGETFIKAIKDNIPNIKAMVEDLGGDAAEVDKLRKKGGFLSMNVLQSSLNANGYFDAFTKEEDSIIYTGNHDNNTIMGWYLSLDEKIKTKMKSNYNLKEPINAQSFIKLVLNSKFKIAIIPIWDYLNLNSEGRFNLPGTISGNNWNYRLDKSIYKDIIK